MLKSFPNGGIVKKHYKEVLMFIAGIGLGYAFGWSQGADFMLDRGLDLLENADLGRMIEFAQRYREVRG